MKAQESKVLIFRELLLPISETFILAQTGALRTYEPLFAGMCRRDPTLAVPGRPILFTAWTEGRLTRTCTRLYTKTKFAPSFHRSIENLRPQLVHAHFAPDGALAVNVARRLRIPLLVTLHGYDVTVKMDFRRRYAELWRAADRFICVSDFIRRKALEAGFPENKLSVHYIGIDRSRFLPSKVKRVEGLVLFVGRLVEKKGCTYLLKAMREVQERQANAQLVLIGDGPLRGSLEREAVSLGIRCKFLGGKPQSVIRDYLGRASVFCAPSVTAFNGDCEGLPIVILEAAAMGLPIVSSFHAGIPEAIIDGESGLLAPERDVSTLAQHILRFLTDSDLRQRCTTRGKEWISERFDLDHQTQLLEHFYSGAVRRNASCPTRR